MDNIKRVREEKNSALETMESIHSEFEGKELSEQAQNKWNEAKSTFESKSAILYREEFIENKKKDASLRNHEDGSEKEHKDFSFKDAIKFAVNPASLSNYKQGFYSDLNRYAEKEASNAGVTLQGGNGLVLPSNVLQGNFRNDLTVGTEGEDIVFEEKGSFIEKLKERMVLTQMGAETLDGLIGDVKFSKEGNSPSFVWEGETNVGNESTPTFGNVTLSPNRGGTYIDVSNQAMKQTSPSVEQRLRKQLIGAVQRGLEGAAIEGAQSGPSGILDLATLVSGTAGHALVVDLETAVAVDDADIGSLGYLTNAKGRGLLKQTVKDSGSGNYVWEDGSVNSYDARVTNLITETASGAPEESPLIFGNFADLMMGMWGGIEILVDPFTQATSGMTRLVTNVYADVQIMHDESFSYAEIETTSA